MTHVRASFRLLFVTGTILIHGLVLIIWKLFTSRAPHIHYRGRSRISNSLANSLARVIGMHIRIEGKAPDPPFILVANHLSWLDIILVQATTRAVLISKSEVASWPVVGWIAREVGTAFIDRERIRDVVRMNARIREILDQGDGIVFFPEGTSTEGIGVSPFRSPLLNYPASESYPVHYAAISYRMHTGNPSETLCWWGNMTFTDHFYGVLTLPGFEAFIRFGNESVAMDDRKLLASRLHQLVSDHFTPVSSLSES